MSSTLPIANMDKIVEITREEAELALIREAIVPDDSIITLGTRNSTIEHIYVRLADCTEKYNKCWQRALGCGTVVISILDASKKSEKIYKCDTKQITIYWCQLCMDYERQFL